MFEPNIIAGKEKAAEVMYNFKCTSCLLWDEDSEDSTYEAGDGCEDLAAPRPQISHMCHFKDNQADESGDSKAHA